MDGNDKKTKLTRVNPTSTEQAKKSKSRIASYMLSYFAIVIAAYYLNIAENDTIIRLVKYVETLIPSINGTAEISKNPNYAKLVLVISWCFIIPSFCFIIKNANWGPRADHAKKTGLLIIATAFFLIGFLWAAIYKIPDTSGQYDRLIFNIIKSFTFGISIWGFIIWVLVSTLLASLIILIAVKARAIFGRN